MQKLLLFLSFFLFKEKNHVAVIVSIEGCAMVHMQRAKVATIKSYPHKYSTSPLHTRTRISKTNTTSGEPHFIEPNSSIQIWILSWSGGVWAWPWPIDITIINVIYNMKHMNFSLFYIWYDVDKEVWFVDSIMIPSTWWII